MLRFVFVKQRAGMFHNDTCCFSNKTCRVGDRAQKSWLDKLQQRHLPNWPLVQKIVHSHKPGKHGSAMTKLHNDAAWHCRVAEGKVVAARIADHIEPHHNDPIKVWNVKLQSL
jgi:hypothetical protein